MELKHSPFGFHVLLKYSNNVSHHHRAPARIKLLPLKNCGQFLHPKICCVHCLMILFRVCILTQRIVRHMKRHTSSKIILVDLDGPLADLEGEFLKRWRKKFPHKFFVPFEERNTFFIHDQYPDHLKLKTEEILRENGFFTALSPVQGGIKTVNILRSLGHTVIICTSDIFANKTALTDKRQWVRKHLDDDFAKAMIFTRD